MSRALAIALIFAAGCDAPTSGSNPDGGSGSDAAVSSKKDGAIAMPDGSSSGPPAGWLFTKGGEIFVSDGGAGKKWMGRGVNFDDIFLCGYNNSLWMNGADQTEKTEIDGLMANWKPNFVRVSLSLASYQTVSWLSNDAQYKTPMTNVIQALGSHAGVYVLVTLRSDASMILQDQTDGDPEATGLPSDANSTPDKNQFPTGTDALYVALVDSFAQDAYVLFGLTNEPGGNKRSNDQIRAIMDHAVGTIRAEEDRLGAPHHIVSVQGNGWTSDISFYAQTPLARDNVVYEVHGYPPMTKGYTYANLPVIIGEYGSLDGNSAPAFYDDVETKQIPNLAWDFDPFSDCAPDLVDITTDATKLNPSAWGKIVEAYLTSHAQ